MKTIAELLLDEPGLTAEERQMIRSCIGQVAGHARHVTDSWPRRWFAATASAAGVALIAMTAIGWSNWTRSAVELVAAVRFAVHLAEEHPGVGLRETSVGNDGRTIYLQRTAVLTNGDIARAEVVEGTAPGTFGVAVEFTAEGAAKIFQVTQRHLGRPIAILLDGNVALAPIVRSPIRSSATINGHFTKAEAERIAAGVRVGTSR
jgi:hypothetical protein